MRDILADDVPLGPILEVRPDLIVLTDFDFDGSEAALSALQNKLAEGGLDLPERFSKRPNTGQPTGLDLDGDGRLGGPRDAQGYGLFKGQGGISILSKYPMTLERDFSGLLWQEVPDGAMMPDDTGRDLQRLSSTAHWVVSVDLPNGPVWLLTLAATPPVFDGPEDRNGRRNRDEVRLWQHFLDGALGAPPERPVIIVGNLNLDPQNGEGHHDAVASLLLHERLIDPMPEATTVNWDSTGPMRVSYVLPDRILKVAGTGVTQPVPDAGPHRLLWVDLVPP